MSGVASMVMIITISARKTGPLQVFWYGPPSG